MRAARLSGFLLLALASCADDLQPRSLLADLRVLAIEARPLEVGPGESVTLRAITVPPPGFALDEARSTWSFCPFSIGATVGYACAVAACETPLVPAADGTVTEDPGARAQECLARLGAGGGELPPGVPAELPRKVDMVFRHVAVATNDETREVVQLVPFYPGGAPSPRNEAPGVQRVEIGGKAFVDGGQPVAVATVPVLAPGAQLEVRVVLAAGSAQAYVDDSGRTETEVPVVSFFTTAGRFDFDRDDGPIASVNLKHEQIPEGVSEALLWALATDLRGGETVVGPFRVAVSP